MFRHQITLALRSLRRRFGYTVVNIVGLTVGLTCCALVAVFLQHELRWDAHHPGADRVYRILSQHGPSTFSSIRFDGFRDDTDSPEEQRQLSRRLTASISAIEQAANYHIYDSPTGIETEAGEAFETDRWLVTTTGSALVDLFAFERVAGSPLVEALREPGSILLTETAAQRYFGDADPIGQTVTLRENTATVEAVVADPPSNSRIDFEMAIHVKKSPYWAAFQYVRLAPGTSPEAIVPLVEDVMREVNPELTEDWGGARLQALTDIYLSDRALYDSGPHGNRSVLWAFAVIGLLVLVITIINYANLSLALSSDRNAEIGVRKALGSVRSQIAGQFLTESTVLTLVCLPLVLGLCAALLPAFNALMDTAIPRSALVQPGVLGSLVGLALLTGLAAGGYPAFVLARKRTVALFDRGLSTGGGRASWSLRHGLIALQFALLIGLGSMSWIANDQLRFMQTENLGYDTENVARLTPPAGNDSALYQSLRPDLLASSAVQEVGMGKAPRPATARGTFTVTGDGRKYDGGLVEAIDIHWFDVMGIEHPEIERMKAEGPSAPPRVLLNETAARVIDVDDPTGERWISDPGGRAFETPPIVGVLPDIYLNSMRQEVSPTAFRVTTRPRWAINMVVRFAPGRLQEGIAHVRSVWAERQAGRTLDISFLDDRVASLYEQERRFRTLSSILAGLAILLAALGLASLVAYLTRLRMKEIGIRKALGGSTASIVQLLNAEYVRLVGAAFLIGAPLAWWAAQSWLDQFAYQVGVSPLVFVGSGVGALAVAVAAVSVQALRAARVDPARVLRAE